MPEPTSDKPSKIKFDGTINAGHVLTFISMVGMGFAVYSSMDKRVLVLEESRKYQQVVDHAQDARATAAMEEVKGLILRVERGLDKVNDKLEGAKR